jgi:HEAT repeat protein
MRRRGDIVSLEAMLESAGLGVIARREAAKALARLGATSAVPLLIRMLRDDEDAGCRQDAAIALRLLRAQQAVPELIAALSDSQSQVRLAAARALVDLPDVRASAALIERLQDSSNYVRTRAAQALGVIEAPEALEPLLAVAGSDSLLVRNIALSAIRRIGGERAETALVELRKHTKNPLLRRMITVDLKHLRRAASA